MKEATFLVLGGIAHRGKSRPKNMFKLDMKNLSTFPKVTFSNLQDKLNTKIDSKPGNCITVNSATSDVTNIVKLVSVLPFRLLKFFYL